MICPDEALRLVLEAAVPLAPRQVPLAEACGLRLAEPFRADRDYPPFPRAMMDGYAVRVAQAGRRVPVAGEVAAGAVVDARVTDEACLEIMTGASCPPGTEAVVPKEQVRREGDRVRLPKKIHSGDHVAAQGSECRAGAVVLRPGDVITPLAVAVIASLGRAAVRATRRPSLGVITTGAERIRPTPGVSSADVFASCRANCYAEIPPGRYEVPAGRRVAGLPSPGSAAPHGPIKRRPKYNFPLWEGDRPIFARGKIARGPLLKCDHETPSHRRAEEPRQDDA